MKVKLVIYCSGFNKIHYWLEFINIKPKKGKYGHGTAPIGRAALKEFLTNAVLDLDYQKPGIRVYIVKEMKAA